MDSDDKKKYLIFGVLAIIFLAGSAYVSSKQNFASQYKIPSIKEMIPASNSAGESEKPFEFKIPAFTGEEKNRITSENCGISFVIPDGWTITSEEEGNRYCKYYVKNPDKRGAVLEIGIPGVLYPEEYVDWDRTIAQMRVSFELTNSSVPQADESYETKKTVFKPERPAELVGISDPMYIFRKGKSAYYMRYGYVDDDGRNMLDDISSVISSVQFPQDASFYDVALRSGP